MSQNFLCLCRIRTPVTGCSAHSDNPEYPILRFLTSCICKDPFSNKVTFIGSQWTHLLVREHRLTHSRLNVKISHHSQDHRPRHSHVPWAGPLEDAHRAKCPQPREARPQFVSALQSSRGKGPWRSDQPRRHQPGRGKGGPQRTPSCLPRLCARPGPAAGTVLSKARGGAQTLLRDANGLSHRPEDCRHTPAGFQP